MARFIRVLALAIVFVASPAFAQETPRRPITLEDLWKTQRVGAPTISPDGKWVCVDVSTYNMAENSSHSDLWLLSTDGKTQRQLTRYKTKHANPVWSPDGKWIAFIAKRSGDTPQVHVISPEGGEAKQVTSMPMPPQAVKWGPESKSLYALALTWPDTPEDEAYRKKEKAKKDDKVQAYVIDDAMYRVWDTWIADGKRPVIFKIDLESGKHTNLFAKIDRTLSPAGSSFDSFDISPDGNELCFVSESAPKIGQDFNQDLYVMSIADPKEPKLITADNPGNDYNPVYSPDGKWIAFNRQTTKYFYADRSRIMLYDRSAQKVDREMTAELDRSCGPVRWVKTDPTLGHYGMIFDVEDKGYHRLYLRLVNSDVLKAVTGGHTDMHPEVSASGDMMAFVRSDFSRPAEVWAFPADGKEPRRIDKFNDDLRKTWDLGPTKEVWFKGADNDEVQMWVVYPPKFDPAKKWPLLQIIHGGPHNGIVTDFHYRWNLHLFASKGYVVGCVNFHGSSGFGQKFCDSITGDVGTKPLVDILKATDLMEKESFIDPNRIAAAGASYGGYMIAWINGHTDRFKAMVCHAGVYNWHSMMASDIVRSRERSLGALPWGDLEKIDRQSPQRLAAKFKTPTLVTHGEKDYRVPITQGFEFYNTLKLKGVPSRLVYFPDENHWVLKPQNAALWHREVFDWLEKHCGSGPRE
jgi:dipeptidyl aminopeptidase/acylaminoacyl peptidase